MDVIKQDTIQLNDGQTVEFVLYKERSISGISEYLCNVDGELWFNVFSCGRALVLYDGLKTVLPKYMSNIPNDLI